MTVLFSIIKKKIDEFVEMLTFPVNLYVGMQKS